MDKARTTNSDAVYSRVLWHLLPFLLACYMAAFLDRNNIGFAKLDFMRNLSMDESTFGLAAGIFYLGYILFEIPSNLLLAKVGARKTIARILLLWGATTIVTAFVQTGTQLTIMRFILGAAEAGFFPGVLLFLTYWVPRQQRARFTSVFMLGIPLSGIVGSPISGWIMRSFAGHGTLRAWQWLFILEGLPALALGVVAWFVLKDSPSVAPWLTASERELILADLAAEEGKLSKNSHSFGAALKDGRLYLMAFLAFALFSASAGFFFWLPSMLRASGIDDVFHVGLVGAIPFSVAAICQIAVARHSDRSGERRWHTAGPTFVGALGWLMLALGPIHNPVYVLAMLSVAAGGSFSAMPAFWAMPPDVLSGKAIAGGIALISTLGAVGGFVSPSVIGWIVRRTGGMAYGHGYLAAILVTSGMVLLCLPRSISENRAVLQDVA